MFPFEDDNLIICIISHGLSYSLECGSCSLLGNEPSYGSTNSTAQSHNTFIFTKWCTTMLKHKIKLVKLLLVSSFL